MAAGLAVGALAAQAGLPRAGLAGVAVAALVSWWLRFRPSEQARAWQRGARGERRTARLLERLGRDGYVVFHDLAMPGSPANIDHLVVGPSGVFVVDSKQWTGSVHQSADGLVWHNHYRLDRTLATVRWQAETLGRLLGVPVAPLVCVHGAHIQGGGLRAQAALYCSEGRLQLWNGAPFAPIDERLGPEGVEGQAEALSGFCSTPAQSASHTGPRQKSWSASADPRTSHRIPAPGQAPRRRRRRRSGR
jgi:hypothetical protein